MLMIFNDVQNFSILENLAWNANTIKLNFGMKKEQKKCNTSKEVQFSLCYQKGKVQIPLLNKPPNLLEGLLNGEDQRRKSFLQNIRVYNNMFSFTSIGGKIDTSMNNGSAPQQFILNGQNYHRIGSLLPEHGSKPKFAQLYIYDTENEMSNRKKHFRSVNI